MRTIIVDDEYWMLEKFSLSCNDIDDLEIIGKFQDYDDAVNFAKENEIDLAFLDICLPAHSGLELSADLRKIYPKIIIVFVSTYENYMPDAFRVYAADYYLIKPYTHDELVSVVERARLLSARLHKEVYIETFGNFNVYINGEFVRFNSKIAKEILALMVNKRGTALSNKEAFYTLWEDRMYDHQTATALRKGLKKLRDTLKDNNIEHIVISSGHEHRINKDMVVCDFYQFLEGDVQAINKFYGEYMSEYSWGEETTATLVSMYRYAKDTNELL